MSTDQNLSNKSATTEQPKSRRIIKNGSSKTNNASKINSQFGELKKLTSEYLNELDKIKKLKKTLSGYKREQGEKEKLIFDIMKKADNTKIEETENGVIIEIKERNVKHTISPVLIKNALNDYPNKDKSGTKLIISIDEIIQRIESKRLETPITNVFINDVLIKGKYSPEHIEKILRLINGSKKKDKSFTTIQSIKYSLKGIISDEIISNICSLISDSQTTKTSQTLVIKQDKNKNALKI